MRIFPPQRAGNFSSWTNKATHPYSPITLSNLDRFGEQVFQFPWLAWVLLHDLGGLLVPTIIHFSSVFRPYSFHVYFPKYPFSYLFSVFLYLFLLSHKNMKTNTAQLSFVRFHSVFIPTQQHRGLVWHKCIIEYWRVLEPNVATPFTDCTMFDVSRKTQAEMHIWSHVHMFPLSEKINFKILKKIRKQYSNVYLHILPSQKFREKRIFSWPAQKRQKIRREKAYFGTKICHFYIPT
jgi:hypothetical protein